MPYHEPDPLDPMELMGVALTAMTADEEDEMVRCLIEEFAWMGFDRVRIYALFRDPNYQATHQFYRRRGDAAVRRLLAEVLGEDKEGVLDRPETRARTLVLPVIR